MFKALLVPILLSVLQLAQILNTVRETASLIYCHLLHIFLFNVKFTGILATKLSPEAWLSTSVELMNRESSGLQLMCYITVLLPSMEMIKRISNNLFVQLKSGSFQWQGRDFVKFFSFYITIILDKNLEYILNKSKKYR